MSSEVIFRRVFTNEYILRKITETIVDDVFGSSEQTYIEYEILGNIIPITLEDMRFTLPGTFTVGDARGYFYDSYLIGIHRVSVEINDTIMDGDIEYRVNTLTKYKWNNLEFREAYLRRVI